MLMRMFMHAHAHACVCPCMRMHAHAVTDVKELVHFSKRDLYEKMAAGSAVVLVLVAICIAAVAGTFHFKWWLLHVKRVWYGAVAASALNGVQISVLVGCVLVACVLVGCGFVDCCVWLCGLVAFRRARTSVII